MLVLGKTFVQYDNANLWQGLKVKARVHLKIESEAQKRTNEWTTLLKKNKYETATPSSTTANYQDESFQNHISFFWHQTRNFTKQNLIPVQTHTSKKLTVMLNVMILKHLFLLNAVSRQTFLDMIKKTPV